MLTPTAAREPRVVVTRAICGIAHMQVCAAADATDAEILAICNVENPAGTSNGWGIVHRGNDDFWGKLAPVECASDATRMHFMVGC